MKIFIYKTAFIAFVFVVIFEVLIGSRINNFKRQIYELTSQQNREQIIIKIKEEIKKANQKEKYLNEEDRILLSTFLKKIIREIELTSN